MPKFMKVATTDELEDQQAKLVEVEGQKIALFRVGEAFHALSDTCTHRGGPLSEGTVEGAEVTCPWHGARFDIKTGAVMGLPAGREVRSYQSFKQYFLRTPNGCLRRCSPRGALTWLGLRQRARERGGVPPDAVVGLRAMQERRGGARQWLGGSHS